MKKTVVVGSINRDNTFLLDHLPNVGETILSRKSYSSTGGKGANQAVALAKLGMKVVMIGAVGNDDPGERAIESLNGYGVSTRHVLKKDTPTGSAFICVDKNAQNTIVVNPGANGAVNSSDIEAVKTVITEADFCLMQLEIDLSVVTYTAKLCKANGVKVILNPAPAVELPDDLLPLIDFLIPNETELKLLTSNSMKGHSIAEKASELIKRGVKALIVTMGEQGAYYFDDHQEFLVPANKTTAVDTTAAGDSFIGAFLSALSRGEEVRDAMKFASLVAGVTVSRPGAAESIPTLQEVEKLKSMIG